jgi:hypothetical protein
MNCRGCGTELDPSQEHSAVDQILGTSLKDAQKERWRVPALRSPRKLLIGFARPCLALLMQIESTVV